MSPEFLTKLDELREVCGFSFHVNSGFRHLTHPEEIKKDVPGTHAQGIAADIRIRGGAQRFKIVSEALKLGFNGIGVANTFVHVDTRKGPQMMWKY